eukprot:15364755-Ditylum_brightwellii.AAC.1
MQKQFKSDNTDDKPKQNNSNKKHHHYSKQELNAIIGKSVKDALKKSHHNQLDSDKEEANAINKFNVLSVSSSGNSSDKDEKRSN